MRMLTRLVGLSLVMIIASSGLASAGLGIPTPWQLGLQDAATPVMADVIGFHTFVLYVVTAIAVFVLLLLLIVMLRFNQHANPNPSRTTHSTPLEIAWTVIPVFILVMIAVPSFRLLFYQLNTPPADLTVKATGKQWYWTYGYPDQGNFEFDSMLVQEADLKPGQLRLLSVDNEMVVPIGKVVRVETTGADVIHSFAVPSFGIKMDATCATPRH